jgi:hypothetical protein
MSHFLFRIFMSLFFLVSSQWAFASWNCTASITDYSRATTYQTRTSFLKTISQMNIMLKDNSISQREQYAFVEYGVLHFGLLLDNTRITISDTFPAFTMEKRVFGNDATGWFLLKCDKGS